MGPRVRLFVLCALVAGSGCVFKLSRMAKDYGSEELGCPAEEVKTAVTLSTPPYTLYTVRGCGHWVRYKGTCESMRSGCDRSNPHPQCDGTCRLLEQVGSGELTEPSK